MLVLTRKLQEQIKIGDQITVTVLKVSGNKVRLGIEAPRNVRVLRTELPEAETTTIPAENTTDAPPTVADAAGDVEPAIMLRPFADDLIQPHTRANRNYSQRRPRFAMPAVMADTHDVSSATAK